MAGDQEVLLFPWDAQLKNSARTQSQKNKMDLKFHVVASRESAESSHLLRQPCPKSGEMSRAVQGDGGEMPCSTAGDRCQNSAGKPLPRDDTQINGDGLN